MANFKALKKCLLSTTERKCTSVFKKIEWKTTEYYAELYQRIEAIGVVIRLFETAANKESLKLKNEIEFSHLDAISLKPSITAEKHKHDKFICIDNRAGVTTFLKFDTKDRRDEWYNCISSVLAPDDCNTPPQRRRSQKDLKKSMSTPKERMFNSEPVGNADGFNKVLDEMKSRAKHKRDQEPPNTSSADEDANNICCHRHHGYENQNDGRPYVNVHYTSKTKDEFTREMKCEKQMTIAHRDVYRDFSKLMKLQSNNDGKHSEEDHGKTNDSRFEKSPDHAEADDPITRPNEAVSDEDSTSTEDEAGTSQPKNCTHINGNNNTVVNASPGSTINFCPKITIGIPGDVYDVDHYPPKKKPKLTKHVYSNIKGESSSQSNSQESLQNEHILEQNRLLRQQNDMLKLLFEKYGGVYEGATEGSIVFRVRFHNQADLKRFWEAYASGELAEDLSQLLLSSEMQEEAGCNLKMLLHFDESVYKNALKALDTNSMTIQVESNNVNDSNQEPSDNQNPAKRKCFPQSNTPESHLKIRKTSTEETAPYEVVAIPEPTPSPEQHEGIGSYQCTPSVVVNESDTNNSCTANDITGDMLKRVKGPSTLGLKLPCFDEFSKTYTVEKISKNVTNNDTCQFKVIGNCLEYDDDNSARKRRIGLDELINVEMNENLQVQTHKYENIICLGTKKRIIFLQTASRNEMKECYEALINELNKSGWNGKMQTTNNITESVKRRATSLKRQHDEYGEDRVKSCVGYTRGFTDIEKSCCKAKSSGTQGISQHTKVNDEESNDVTAITRDTKSLQIQTGPSSRKYKKKPPEVLPKPHRRFHKDSFT